MTSNRSSKASFNGEQLPSSLVIFLIIIIHTILEGFYFFYAIREGDNVQAFCIGFPFLWSVIIFFWQVDLRCVWIVVFSFEIVGSSS